MAVGYLSQGKCFSTSSGAADAFFLASSPFVTPGSTSYYNWFEKIGSTWYLQRQMVSNNGTVSAVSSSLVSTPTFPTCDPTSDFFDGLTLGWGVAFAMVAAWAIRTQRLGL